MKTQIEMKKSQMVEMGNQSATINAQIGQAKSETERMKAQVQVFQNSTVAGNGLHHLFSRVVQVMVHFILNQCRIRLSPTYDDSLSR